MASSPHTPAPDSPAAPRDSELPVPPGWTRKLVPRKGKGITPKKEDVVYVAPDGEEIKSKTRLQRYLKAHPGGPAISEFNWTSGETPRRSARLTSKTPTDSTEAEVTPKRGKRNAVQISQEETKEDQAAVSPPPKRAKKTPLASDEKDAGGDITVVAGKEEPMEDVEKQDEISPSDEGAYVETIANGILDIQSKVEELAEQGGNDNGSSRLVVEENIEKGSGEEETKPEEMMEEKVANFLEPIHTFTEKTEQVSEPVSEQSAEVPEESKDKALETAEVDTEKGEPLDPLPVKIIELTPEPVDTPKVVEPIEIEKDALMKEATFNNEEQGKVLEEDNCQIENLCYSGQIQDHGNSNTQVHSSEPVDAAN